MVPAARAHASRRITAGALIAASVSGFRFVRPEDEAAQIFRYICLAGGGIGFLWFTWLLFFPAKR
jgi:hypothetical protein